MLPIQLATAKWDPTGENNGISYNLALWAIHMLAAISRDVRTGYKDIADDEKYLEIGF